MSQPCVFPVLSVCLKPKLSKVLPLAVNNLNFYRDLLNFYTMDDIYASQLFSPGTLEAIDMLHDEEINNILTPYYSI